MNTNSLNKYILSVLTLSLIINGYFLLYSNSKIKNNTFCSQFNEQVSKRIKTNYTNGDVKNVYPDEIFFSKKADSCIAIWQNTEVNYANNGTNTQYVIIDAITNENIFSSTTFNFNDIKYNEELNLKESNNETVEAYYKKIKELKD